MGCSVGVKWGGGGVCVDKSCKIQKLILLGEVIFPIFVTACECIKTDGGEEGHASEMLCHLHGNREMQVMGVVVFRDI